ncbi:MAG: isoprenylcysteine carboxylmethyltransferase family protein [Caldilineaceae bacterium]
MSTTSASQSTLRKTVIGRLLAGILVVGAIFFLPAGTARYWEAWLYLAVLFVPMSIFAVYLLRTNPALLERRMKTREAEAQQRWIITLMSVLFLIIFVLPGFDKRFGWSSVPAWLVIAANGMVLVGYLLVVFVLLKNEYAARTIAVEAQQQVITSGPYALVRHPMYTAMTLIILFSALALGSYWALIPAALFPLLLVARILNEEAVLHRELADYDDYCQTVHYRLLPGVW